MMTTAHPIILHHFEKSPFSEKVRVVFGLKNIEWISVLISRIMPRPDLMPLTGGYRRTPVMQIGADIYCDTQCIIRELERRFPEPTLFPNGYQGISWGTAMWTDRSFFQNTVNLVFGSLADQVPQDFIADREKLRSAKFDVPAMTAAIPQMRDHVRAHLPNADEMLVEFGNTRAWEKRMRSVGHGRFREISTSAALDIAASATPQTAILADPDDPNGRKPGDRVEVMPDDYGKIKVSGEIDLAVVVRH